MTDSQKFEAYGRAMAELKQAKFELAAAHQRLSAFISTMKEVVSGIENFQKNPLARVAADNRPLADLGHGWHSQMRTVELPDVMHDVFVAAKLVEKLQAQVDAFDK